MSLPRISVIMPCLNQSAFVERALCSVLDQGYENLELIVLDGGSDDGSVELIRRYESELAYFATEEDQGPADALNRGLARATGEVVGFLNGDDVYLPGALHAVARTLGPNGGASWAVGQALRIGPSDQPRGCLRAQAPKSLAAFLADAAGTLPWPASFFRKALFTRHGRLDRRMQFAFDYEWECRLLAAGVVPVILRLALAARREYDFSRTAQNLVEQGRERLAAAQRYGEHLPLAQRYALWRQCDRRERFYALAEAEAQGREARRFLAPQLLRRPWWMADQALRHALLHGVEESQAATLTRRAA